MGRIFKWIFCAAVSVFTAIVILSAGLVYLLGLDEAKVTQLVRFFATMRFIETEYVDDVEPSKLIDGAIFGMVRSLGDPHSAYLDPATYKKLKEHSEGTFGGIGVVMGFDDSEVKVISVMEGTPGAAAGLKAGDRILKVDGEETKEMEPELVAASIRGEPGSKVVLTIARAGEANRDYAITRDHIRVKTVAGRMLEGAPDIGYIRIVQFSENTGKEFKDALSFLKEGGAKGLILDLRANPGGLLTSCVEIAKEIVPAGLIVSVVERDGTREEYFSERQAGFMPMVVLIDGNSASASEILAGALHDTGAAELVGKTSYGKGSVQVIMPIPGQADAVKLTIARYYTPSGESIQGKGIRPDVEAELPEGATEDTQLSVAIARMKALIGRK
ncbi:MAG: S41 family peptidase [Schwartzia sp.]|nr:S41 family peptidase [Schwartzia sp. (in: firmicutes)]